MDKKDLILADSIQKTMPQIWKISHGSHGRGVKKELLDKLEKRHVVAVDSVTKAVARQKVEQGEMFTAQIKKGDFFYLCYGRNIRLLGQFTSDKALPNKEMGGKWCERNYQVIAQTKNMSGYEGKRKLWTPNFNSTCIRIKPNERKQFEDLILKPYFDMTLNELFPSGSNDVIAKIARISWNTNNWTRPSGPEGKSKAKDAYEGIYGFAHEEWLLDDSRIVDGFHYGFLQQFSIKSRKYENQAFDIHLYAINPQKKRVYVGIIHNLIVTSADEQERVFNYYDKKGWLKEMCEEIRRVGGIPHNMEGRSLFNVKFKIEDATICDSDNLILEKDGLGKDRYRLMDMKPRSQSVKNKRTGRTEYLSTDTIYRDIKSREIETKQLHKKIQNALKKKLEPLYTEITFEKQYVDIRGKEKATNELHFFEVKVLKTAKECIREVFGQILEYAHYPNVNLAQKLFIVGDKEPSNEDKKYLDFIRETYNIPIWYRWYEIAKDSLHKQI